jgi:hypothetical protein
VVQLLLLVQRLLFLLLLHSSLYGVFLRRLFVPLLVLRSSYVGHEGGAWCEARWPSPGFTYQVVAFARSRRSPRIKALFFGCERIVSTADLGPTPPTTTTFTPAPAPHR